MVVLTSQYYFNIGWRICQTTIYLNRGWIVLSVRKFITPRIFRAKPRGRGVCAGAYAFMNTKILWRIMLRWAATS